jgi:hypothetical protein
VRTFAVFFDLHTNTKTDFLIVLSSKFKLLCAERVTVIIIDGRSCFQSGNESPFFRSVPANTLKQQEVVRPDLW